MTVRTWAGLAACATALAAAYAHEPADDHGDTRLTSTRVEHYGVSQTGKLDSMDDVDVFRLDLQGRAELEMRSSRALDLKGTLYDSEGTVLAEDDDSGTDLNFRIVQTLDGGVYYVAVESDMGDTGDYKMTPRIRRAGDDHGNTAGASTVLPIGIRTTGRIAPADDVDTFRVEVSEATGLRISSGGPTDTMGELRDSADAVLIAEDGGGDRGNFRIERHVEPGIYYVVVTAAAVGSYTVGADLYASDDHDDDHGDDHSSGSDDDVDVPSETAWEVFQASISAPIVQAKCVTCHYAGGDGSQNLVFVTAANDGYQTTNFNAFEDFLADDHAGHDHEDNEQAAVILDKVRGRRGHGGGEQIADGSQLFQDLEHFLGLLAEEVAGDDDHG